MKEKFVCLYLRDTLLRTRCAEKISFEENPTTVARLPYEMSLDLNIFAGDLDNLDKSNSARKSTIGNEKIVRRNLPRRFMSLN